MRHGRYLFFLACFLIISCTHPGTVRPSRMAQENAPRHLSFTDVGSDTVVLDFSTEKKLPVWSLLTDFEIRALENIPKARAGDPDALLALSLMASGDVRDGETFEEIKQRIHEFVRDIRPRIAAYKTVMKKGERIHRSMHEVFFNPQGIGKKGRSGYAFSNSRVSGIFENGKYNCISASILYIILLRFFDLDAKGAVLPEHVFVELTDPPKETISVETTSIDGYNLIHDRSFYEEKRGIIDSFFNPATTTYDEYLNREILSPVQLIAYNMNNQHTSEDRMGWAGRFRLAEMRALIMTHDRDSQYNRLVHYCNLLIEYEEKGKSLNLTPLMDRVKRELAVLKAEFHQDKELISILAWLEYYELLTLQRQGRYDHAIEKQIHYLKELDPDLKDIGTIGGNHIYLMKQALSVKLQEKRFTDAETMLIKFNEACGKKLDLSDLFFSFYFNSALNDWDSERWEKSVEMFTRSLNYANSEKNRSLVLKNLEGAYYNWSISYSNLENDSLATQILEKGLSQNPGFQKLRERLNELKKR